MIVIPSHLNIILFSLFPGLTTKYVAGIQVCEDLEDGHIDVNLIKKVVPGSESIDLQAVCKRHLLDASIMQNCVTICYGHNMADNRHLEFVMPTLVAKSFQCGLQKLVRAVLIQKRFHTDRRIQWLKELYLQLYYENGREHGPLHAEAIKVYFTDIYKNSI